MPSRIEPEILTAGLEWTRTFYYREDDGTTVIPLTGYAAVFRVKAHPSQADADALIAYTAGTDAEIVLDEGAGSVAVTMPAADSATLDRYGMVWAELTATGPGDADDWRAVGWVVVA